MVDTNESVEIYEAEPSPLTLEANDVLRAEVETRSSKLGEEINPEVWRPSVVETKLVFRKAVDT